MKQIRNYEIIKLIGVGGMGEVYQARDTTTGKPAAIKMLRPEVVEDNEHLLNRFLREGEALQKLDHPNIVKILESFDEDGNHYLVMEFVTGGDVYQQLKTNGPFSVRETLRISLELSDALARAHHLDIIHRDIKPANVLLAEDGAPRLTDFGVARFTNLSAATQEGAMIGTFAYMSPEGFRGEALDQRADIWSLGVLMYQMLVGELPFRGEHHAGMLQAVLSQPVPEAFMLNESFPAGLRELALSMLAKEKDQRIGSMRQVGAQLESLLTGTPVKISTKEISLEAPAPAEPELDTAPPTSGINNLPTQATPFIGREKEKGEIIQLLSDPDVRLVTLIGPGGIGKTRLSLAVAKELIGDYPDGVFFVELAPLLDAEQVLPTIAGTLGVSESGDEPLLEVLTRQIENKRMLLVIDNYEHVIEAGHVTANILAKAPQVKILTSSREALRVYGEHEYQAQPLSLPDEDADQTISTISEYEAVALFVARAQSVQQEFKITAENAAAVVEICRKLDGLPLAIELAAARIRIFEPNTLLTRLSDTLKTLKGGARNLPSRQQTIRGAIEWSYDLLDEDEKILFARLGVFQGGHSLEAAEVMCTDELSIDPLDGLESLLSKSLIKQEKDPNGEAHFTMLETIHAYALEQLKAAGDENSVRQWHAEHFATFAEQVDEHIDGADQLVWLNRVKANYENFRLALTWCFDGNDIQNGLRITAGLGGYWRYAYVIQESLQWLQKAIRFAEQGQDEIMGKIYSHAGYIYWGKGNAAEAKEIYEKALAIETKLGNQVTMARILTSLGLFAGDDGSLAPERTLEGIAIAREIDDKAEIAHGLNVLGEIYRMQGRYEEAEEAYAEGADIARDSGNILRLCMLQANLGFIDFHRGNYAEGLEKTLEVYKLAMEINNEYILTDGLVFQGAPIAILGDVERGIKLIGAGDGLIAGRGAERQEADQVILDEMLAVIHSQIDDETFDRLYSEGRKLTQKQAIDLLFEK